MKKSMVLACSRIYVLYIIYMKVKRDSQGLVFVKWTETTFWYFYMMILYRIIDEENEKEKEKRKGSFLCINR